jgi:hypothetical protein
MPSAHFFVTAAAVRAGLVPHESHEASVACGSHLDKIGIYSHQSETSTSAR